MAIYELEDRRPKVHPGAYVHPLASVIGAVTIGDRCFIGPGASLRAEWCEIVIGDKTSVQDSSTIHGGLGQVVRIGEGTHLGHGAVVHGSTVGKGVLIGMNAVVNDGAEVGDYAIVGAGCIVPRNMKIPSRKVVVGVPARVVGEVSEAEVKRMTEGENMYASLPPRYAAGLREISKEEAGENI
jgi:carbonic anhydrase/acetyltransferase-like protein (isoleucine patch superfamily)